MEWIINIIVNAVASVFGAVLQAIITPVYNWIVSLLLTPAMGVLDRPYVQTALHISQAIVLSVLGFQVALTAMRIYILRAEGRNDTDPADLFRRATLTVAAIFSCGWLADLFIKFNNGIVGGIRDLGIDLNGAASNFAKLFVYSGSPAVLGLALVLLMLIFAVLAMVLCVQYAIRNAELMVLLVLAPWMALSLLTSEEDSGTWGSWVKELAAIILSQAVHMLSIYLFMNLLGGSTDIQGYALACGMLFVMIRTPTILRNFLYSTGSGRMATGAGQMGFYWLMVRRTAGSALRVPTKG